MIKKITTAFIFLLAFSINGQQEKLNNYKYIIVSEKFDFLKQTDQYQTSSLTAFLLKKKGFRVFLSNEKLPKMVTENRCLAITASVLDDSSLFSVKNKIQFKDCYGAVLFTSETGKSKEKDYKKAYHEAIRNAFTSMENLEYSYKPLVKDVKVEKIIDEVKVPKKVVAPVSVSNKTVKSAELPIAKNVLYAQGIENGFQLVNTKPEVVFIALKTKMENVYIIKDKNGILYKNGINWVAEYYKNKVLVTKSYQIRF